MIERPILFSAPMARAILDGRKTVTRRVCRAHEVTASQAWRIGGVPMPCPYGVAGDRLWVRETWGPCAGGVVYRADGGTACPDVGRWRPGIHMPRRACRLVLAVESVRVERLHEITEDDARAEGVELPCTDDGCPPGFAKPLIRVSGPCPPILYLDGVNPSVADMMRAEFASLWDAINGRRDGGAYAWDRNPWVWRIAFRRIDGEELAGALRELRGEGAQ